MLHMVEHLRLVKYRRPIALALSISAIAFAVLAALDAFQWADIPGRGYLTATWLLIAANWVFTDVSSRWRTPKVTKTKR
ncbi:hypothetical protein ASD81_19345 [Nocardioides sp. Root614]|nr:hypothetical protein ASD81_19345 [Nocardioides sp. Root614]KRA86792.1 hypothetical protein ASD84_21560 [Nocardioides sp. Root682]